MSNLNFASQRLPAHRAPRRGGQAGFSLMEVMVVAAIVAIMAVLAVPSFSGMVQRQRVKNAADAVLSDLRWARSEAIKRGTNISVIFDNDGYRIISNGEEIKSLSLTDLPQVSVSVSPGKEEISFEPVQGKSMNAQGQSTNTTVTIEGTSVESGCMGVVVSFMGRVRLDNEKECNN